jgi:hypothetical protein
MTQGEDSTSNQTIRAGKKLNVFLTRKFEYITASEGIEESVALVFIVIPYRLLKQSVFIIYRTLTGLPVNDYS